MAGTETALGRKARSATKESRMVVVMVRRFSAIHPPIPLVPGSGCYPDSFVAERRVRGAERSLRILRADPRGGTLLASRR